MGLGAFHLRAWDNIRKAKTSGRAFVGTMVGFRPQGRVVQVYRVAFVVLRGHVDGPCALIDRRHCSKCLEILASARAARGVFLCQTVLLTCHSRDTEPGFSDPVSYQVARICLHGASTEP